MYKLLVVDDECMIADLLYEYLQQKLEDELVLYKAYSGRSAIGIMEEMTIDILITDVTMPGIDGIMLHKKAREINPCCKVIFLTGFSDFGNIQYALRNESVDFILKSESNDVIYGSIRKAINELDQAIHAERMQILVKQQWELTLPILQERLVLSVLDGEGFNRLSFEEVEFPLSLDSQMLLMMGRVDEGYSISRTVLFKLKCTVDEYLRQNSRVFSVIHGYDILWMIQSGKKGECPLCVGKRMFKYNKTAYTHALTNAQWTLPKKENINMAAIQDLCLKAFNVSMSFVLSEDLISYEDISVTWHGLKQTIRNLFSLSPGMLLIEHNGHNSSGIKSDWLYIRNILQKISLSIEGLQREKYEKHYAELMRTVQTATINRPEKMEIALRIYMAFLSHSNSNGIHHDIGFVDYLTQDDRWDNYDALFAKIADDFFAKQRSSAFEHTNQILGNLRQYIHANLGGDTSQEKLAEITHFSPSYLSRLFKQVTNMSLTEYIGRLKYEKATKLLVSTDMKIMRIATELGFETQSYFWRFFKKYAGVGPQEYRDGHVLK